MRSRRRAWSATAGTALVLAAAGCNLILGNHEVPYVDAGRGSADSGVGALDGAPDATADRTAEAAPVCAPDAAFSTDPDNCGRCGHACLGGTCVAGTCQPVA